MIGWQFWLWAGVACGLIFAMAVSGWLWAKHPQRRRLTEEYIDLIHMLEADRDHQAGASRKTTHKEN